MYAIRSYYGELCRAEIFRYLARDETAAEEAIEAAESLFAEAEFDADLKNSEQYANARFYLHSMKGEADSTRQWVGEHKRRYREEFKGDLAEEASYNFV